MPFFRRVLIHLVRLDHGVIQQVAVQPSPRMFLEVVPPLQQVLEVATQLSGHLGGGLAHGDTVEDQQELAGVAVRPLEGRPGPGVEHAAAGAAPVPQHRPSSAAVYPQGLPLTAPRAGQPLRVEHLDESAVARVLVHVALQREIHGYGPVR
jgi:hypothetical protein